MSDESRIKQRKDILRVINVHLVHAGKVDIRELCDGIYDLVKDKDLFNSCRIYKDGQKDLEINAD